MKKNKIRSELRTQKEQRRLEKEALQKKTNSHSYPEFHKIRK